MMEMRVKTQKGFILISSLLLLTLLSMLAAAMFYVSRTGTQSSASAEHSTEATYYTETAINYMAWALANDAEFDSFNYTGSYVHGAFAAPSVHASAPKLETFYGDLSELMGWDGGLQVGIPADPGPTIISDSGNGIVGQVKYFDNTPMKDRALCFEDQDVFNNCTDITVAPGARVSPVMHNISVRLPRYIKLDIADDGAIAPSIPRLPHHNPPEIEHDRNADGTYDHNGDIPKNGAIVWITAGDRNNPARDVEICFAPYSAGVFNLTGFNGGVMSAVNCSCNNVMPAEWYACDAHANANANPAAPVALGAYGAANMGAWISGYSIVAYAIGYVNGKPINMLRAVIQ